MPFREGHGTPPYIQAWYMPVIRVIKVVTTPIWFVGLLLLILMAVGTFALLAVHWNTTLRLTTWIRHGYFTQPSAWDAYSAQHPTNRVVEKVFTCIDKAWGWGERPPANDNKPN